MGIRYFAKAVAPDDVARASTSPLHSVCCCPPRSAERGWWGPDRKIELPRLDLDKAWRGIQLLLAGEEETGWLQDRLPRRAAYELVRGDSNGMNTYRRLLDPGAVDSACADLEAFCYDRESECGERTRSNDAQQADYVDNYLEKAREFARSVAGRELYVYYSIG